MTSLIFGILVGILTVSHGLDPDCSNSAFSVGAIITKRDMILNEHQKELISSVSFTQCGLHCLERDWCISINFEIGKKRGKCFLNDAGLQQEFSRTWERERFMKKEGFVFSQLRPYLIGSPVKKGDIFRDMYSISGVCHQQILNSHENLCQGLLNCVDEIVSEAAGV
ncbi:uncharacterized protein LOC116308096 [Actinia tenebrosa]|uniref:Uncharacterized protein LOC116308096 n=1 Tax=Actinia tenebrosa TaxID=6105 RepID=A0A6P8J3Z0_ACTTE|nr:uncharacterized protein LOC116308096 [Actinia tenebrosa]